MVMFASLCSDDLCVCPTFFPTHTMTRNSLHLNPVLYVRAVSVRKLLLVNGLSPVRASRELKPTAERSLQAMLQVSI